jgi:hypothetical protein
MQSIRLSHSTMPTFTRQLPAMTWEPPGTAGRFTGNRRSIHREPPVDSPGTTGRFTGNHRPIHREPPESTGNLRSKYRKRTAIARKASATARTVRSNAGIFHSANFILCCRQPLCMSEIDTIVILMHEFDYSKLSCSCAWLYCSLSSTMNDTNAPRNHETRKQMKAERHHE